VSQPLVTVAYAETKLPAPTGIKVAEAGSSAARLVWNEVKGAVGYRIYKYSSKDGGYITYADTKLLYCYITGLSPSSKYKFRVAALVENPVDYTAQTLSDPVIVTTTALEAPSSISVSVNSSSATLRWNSCYGAAGYRVYKYNSKKGKYVKYKDVENTGCTIEGLTEGKTYKFRVAALVKSGEKLRVQRQSAVITVAPTKAEELTLPEFPKYGVSSTEALKFMNASSYTITDYYDDGTMYVLGSGTSIYGGDYTGLVFNGKDQYYGVVMMKSTSLSDKSLLDALRKRNGEPKVLSYNSLDNYVWETKDEIKFAMFYDGTLMYAEISYEYTTEDMEKAIADALKQYETASSAL
jgi:hypothetical protein